MVIGEAEKDEIQQDTVVERVMKQRKVRQEEKELVRGEKNIEGGREQEMELNWSEEGTESVERVRNR